MEYLEGVSLAAVLNSENACAVSLFKQLGQILAVIHQESFDTEGALNEDLEIEPGLPPILKWYSCFLNGIPGKKLGPKWKREIKEIIEANGADLERMTKEFVLTHGDFRPTNILVLGDRVTGVLDWEFALSAPRYFDIGQFIRQEEDLNEAVKQAFYRGYQEVSKERLPKDWERLARLMDIATMMSFLDRCEDVTELDIEMIERIKVNSVFVKR
jgi:Ser/Thr protein kinase RdoA (MazF antagonist)